MKKKIVSILLACVVLFLMTTTAALASESSDDTASNSKQWAAQVSDLSNAVPISLNTQYKGMLTESVDARYYRFTLPSSGAVNLKMTAYIKRSHWYLYDSNGEAVYKSEYNDWNDTTKRYDANETMDLTKGTYYFCVEKAYDYTGNYNFKLSLKSAGESFTETGDGTNNTMETANKISLKKSYKGQVAGNDEKDFYKFTLPSSGAVNLKMTAYIKRSHWYLYDSNGEAVYKSEYNDWNDTTKRYDANETMDLTKGTYYFCVEKAYDYTGNYNFKLNFKSAKESFSERGDGTNNSMATANKISLGKSYKGQIAGNDDMDFYKFTLKSTTTVRLKVSANIYKSNWYLYNSRGNEIKSSTYNYWNDRTKRYTCNEKIRLSKGTYYFCLEEGNYTGNYTFSVSK